jgi:hypothetical protein
MKARSVVCDTIEDRLLRVEKTLRLIAAVGDDGLQRMDAAALLGVIAESASDLLAELAWLNALPGPVLNLPAPTDDQIRDHAFWRKPRRVPRRVRLMSVAEQESRSRALREELLRSRQLLIDRAVASWGGGQL